MFLRSISSIIIASILFVTSPLSLMAHPMDEYLQATYITFDPDYIGLELDLTPGLLIAPDFLKQIDTDGDQQLSVDEQSRYVEQVVQELVVKVDEQPQRLTLRKQQFPTWLVVSAGAGTIQLDLTVDVTVDVTGVETGTHQFFFQNNHQPFKSKYQVNALVPQVQTLQIGKPTRAENQQSVQIDYNVTALSPNLAPVPTPQAAVQPAPDEVETSSGRQEQLLSYLSAPVLSPWLVVIALGIAVVLGGLHALTPGHGKTLVAAYLIGSRGTVKHAVWLGGIVTFTHTASVIGFGALALLASQWIVPSILLPILEIGSGLLVLFLGIQLVWQRWRGLQQGDHHHDHEHDHSHLHDHTYGHDHRNHHHHHMPTGVTLGNLLSLGVSGGLVPCPEALGILLVAIGINRITLGLGLIVAFSFGLAAVLIAIGVLLVRSQGLLAQVSGIGGDWQRLLPIASALIVTLLGAGIVVNGIF